MIPIEVKIPKFIPTSTRKVVVNEEEFKKDLLKFIDNIENQQFYDQELYNKIVEYHINKQEFDKMIVELNKFAEYDDDKSSIGFPYEDWYDRILEVFTNSKINKI